MLQMLSVTLHLFVTDLEYHSVSKSCDRTNADCFQPVYFQFVCFFSSHVILYLKSQNAKTSVPQLTFGEFMSEIWHIHVASL